MCFTCDIVYFSLSRMIWTSWVEPEDAVVNFHRPQMFGPLGLCDEFPTEAPQAARLVATRALRLLRSPKVCLERCPSGSLLVKSKYASLCGSDFPYFRASEKGNAAVFERFGSRKGRKWMKNMQKWPLRRRHGPFFWPFSAQVKGRWAAASRAPSIGIATASAGTRLGRLH